MKFTAAAILAIGAAATKITQYGGEGDLPFPAPDCPPKPSKSEMYGATPEEVFDHIDADGSGLIDAHEGFNALYCMVEWGEMTREEAEGVFEYLGSFVGEDYMLSKSEAKAAMEAHPYYAEGGEELAQKKECGPKPSESDMKAAEPEDVFDMIDADGSGDIDEKEGKFALGCAVEWELLTVEEAEWAGEFLSGHAGEDGKLDKAEAQAAMEELEGME